MTRSTTPVSHHNPGYFCVPTDVELCFCIAAPQQEEVYLLTDSARSALTLLGQTQHKMGG